MKLGSLFDGSGGFPLAASMCGIEPVWAAEVEPYPIAVTRSRFPKMYETRSQIISRLCYERDDLVWSLKEAERKIKVLLCENEDLKKLCEKQARLNLTNAALALELDKVKAERDASIPVETVAKMFLDFTGDKCACNFNDTDMWLPFSCEHEANGMCPDPRGELDCWKQYIKHYKKREEVDDDNP